MMKVAVLLFVALAVSANGLGFPNFNLGCPLGQAGRFSADSQAGVIPYCRVVGDAFFNDLNGQLVARTGYTPVYHAAAGWVIITPTVSLASVARTSETAYPGVVVSIGTDAMQQFEGNMRNSMINVGTEVGFIYAGCTSLDTQRISGASFGLGLSNHVACPWENVLGHFEYANRAGGSNQGRAQGLTLPRPYLFYGL
jgi:hypothetical protein